MSNFYFKKNSILAITLSAFLMQGCSINLSNPTSAHYDEDHQMLSEASCASLYREWGKTNLLMQKWATANSLPEFKDGIVKEQDEMAFIQTDDRMKRYSLRLQKIYNTYETKGCGTRNDLNTRNYIYDMITVW